jgi:hypothetical protein
MKVAQKEQNSKVITLLEAKNITLERERIEREVLPLGDTQVEVELALVAVEHLKFDQTNPRVAFRLKSNNEPSPTQERLQEILWDDDEVKALKNSIELYGGLIEAIIVANDGTVLEGNCRLACLKKLKAEAEAKGVTETLWDKVKARILAPGIDRSKIEILLGELHFAGKNKWSAFEQAAHIYNMIEGGENIDDLAKKYRQSKSYIIAKNRAYKLMRDKFVPMAEEARKKDEYKLDKGEDRYWSWFEELYKTCSPTPAGKEPAKKTLGFVYDGPELEQKFCEWMIANKLPKAEQVRKLPKVLKNKEAIVVFEQPSDGGGIEKAMELIAEDDPTLNSKLWKQVQVTAELLGTFPLDELEELRQGDAAKVKIFEDLTKAVDRIRKEATKQ